MSLNHMVPETVLESRATDAAALTSVNIGKRTLADRYHNVTTAWVVLAISLCITVFSWWLSSEYVSKRAQDRFNFEVQKASQAVVKRMQEYEQVLRGGQGLFIASDEVSRRDWHDYVENLRIDTYWPGIQGIGLALMLTPEALESHVQAVRQSGYPDYSVHPEGLRPQYSSIVYLEPFSGRNLRAFGYDMFSEPTRQAAMVKARDSGNPAMSGKVVLVQETGQDMQAGFLMYLPLYRKDMPLATEAQRRAAHYGYVYSPFRIKDLMRGILGADTPHLDFSLYDGEAIREDAMLHATSVPHIGDMPPPLYTRVEQIGLPGRTWTVRFDSSRILERELESAQPLIIGIGGLGVDVLLFLIIWSLSQSRKRATRLVQTMAALVNEQRLAANVFNNAREGILVTGSDARIIAVNQMFMEITGYSRMDVLGRNPSMLSAGRHDHVFFEEMWEELLSKGHWSGEVWDRRKSGSEFVAAMNISSVKDTAGRTTHYVGLFSDITPQKDYQMHLEFMAQHDVLTRLPNRTLLMDRLQVAMSLASRSGKHLVVAYVDLDGFKPINDQLGHEAGDQALISVAQRLRACIRAGDTVARLGGDEFVLLIMEDRAGDYVNAMERARESLSIPYRVSDREMLMSASIGYTIYPLDQGNAEALIQHADKAMYQAKQQGRNQCVQYRPAASGPASA